MRQGIPSLAVQAEAAMWVVVVVQQRQGLLRPRASRALCAYRPEAGAASLV